MYGRKSRKPRVISDNLLKHAHRDPFDDLAQTSRSSSISASNSPMGPSSASSSNSSLEPVFLHKPKAETTFDKLFAHGPSSISVEPVKPTTSVGQDSLATSEDDFCSARSILETSSCSPALFASLCEDEDQMKLKENRKPRKKSRSTSRKRAQTSSQVRQDRLFSDDTFNHEVSYINESDSGPTELSTDRPRISLLELPRRPPVITSTPMCAKSKIEPSIWNGRKLSEDFAQPELPCNISRSPKEPISPSIQEPSAGEVELADIIRNMSSLNMSPERIKPARKMVRIGGVAGISIVESPTSSPQIQDDRDESGELVQVQGGKKWRRTLFIKKRQSSQKLELGSIRRHTMAISRLHGQHEVKRDTELNFSEIHEKPDEERVPKSSFCFESSRTVANESSILVQPELSTVDKVLQRCGRPQIVPFNELYPEEVYLQSKKVGEGSYGEVFLLPSTLQTNPDLPPPVLKVVPVDGTALINGEPQTLLKDMLAEIVVSAELSKLGDQGLASSFVKVVDCFLTEGRYPKKLLELWDAFDEEKGSENDRPDSDLLPHDQRFVTLVFGNGGKDLEASELTNASKAVSIFNQVVHALAVAEHENQFEHRDLHWGNILVRPTEEKSFIYSLDSESLEVKSEKIQATIIDFSLSRLTSKEDHGTVIFNDLGKDPALFKASGDYQFDIYRMMKTHVNEDWGGFHPKTNIFWLHYLLDKLIDAVPYKMTKSKLHRQSMAKLRSLYAEILEFNSAKDFVLQSRSS